MNKKLTKKVKVIGFLNDNPDIAKSIDILSANYSRDIHALVKNKNIECTVKISFAFMKKVEKED